RRDTDAVVRPLPLSSRPDRHAAALNQRRTAHHGLRVLGARACAGKLSRLLLLIVISRLLTAISKPLTAISWLKTTISDRLIAISWQLITISEAKTAISD